MEHFKNGMQVSGDTEKIQKEAGAGNPESTTNIKESKEITEVCRKAKIIADFTIAKIDAPFTATVQMTTAKDPEDGSILRKPMLYMRPKESSPVSIVIELPSSLEKNPEVLNLQKEIQSEIEDWAKNQKEYRDKIVPHEKIDVVGETEDDKPHQMN